MSSIDFYPSAQKGTLWDPAKAEKHTFVPLKGEEARNFENVEQVELVIEYCARCFVFRIKCEALAVFGEGRVFAANHTDVGYAMAATVHHWIAGMLGPRVRTMRSTASTRRARMN